MTVNILLRKDRGGEQWREVFFLSSITYDFRNVKKGSSFSDRLFTLLRSSIYNLHSPRLSFMLNTWYDYRSIYNNTAAFLFYFDRESAQPEVNNNNNNSLASSIRPKRM